MRALGIDVGVRKGLDAVALDESLKPRELRRHVTLQELESLIGMVRPDVVAIDAPPSWAPAGERSRRTEREIRRLGIICFTTPAPERGESHPFYSWMVVGFRAFRIAEGLRFHRYADGPVLGTAIEVFPHASAVVLRGALGPPGTKKRGWRRSVLQPAGVDVTELRGPDQVDAALAALTGLIALEGRFCAPGDPAEGVIVLPVASLPEARFEREIQ